MLETMDKISLWAAIAILGYLAYTTMERKGLSIETEKELPEITKKMLNPVFIEPNDHVSPTGRDPFEVDWATYFDISEMTGETKAQAIMTTESPVKLTFTKKLMGILMSGDGRDAALIDGRVYQVGSLIDGTDPKTCWKIQAIKKNEVIVTLGKTSRTLTIFRGSEQENTTAPESPEEVTQ